MSEFRTLNSRLNRFKGQAILVALMSVLLAVVIISQANFISQILSQLHQGQIIASSWPKPFALLALLLLGRVLLMYGSQSVAANAAGEVKRDFHSILVGKFSEKTSQGEGFSSGGATSLYLEAVDALEAYYFQYLPQLVLAVCIPVGILLFVFPTDWLSGLVLFVTAPLIPFFMFLIGKSVDELTKKQWKKLGRLGNHFFETIQAIEEIKKLNLIEKQRKEVRTYSQEYATATIKVLQVTFLSAFALEILGTLSIAIIAVQIGLRLLNGNMMFQTALMIIIIAPEFYLPLRLLGLRFHAAINAKTAISKIQEFLHSGGLTNKQIELHVAKKAKLLPSSIRLDNVSYAYGEQSMGAINQVTYEFAAGKITAVVGHNGSGKTTLMKMLLRFIEPQSGIITLDGGSFDELPVKVWRENVAWIPAKPSLFIGSVRENLALWNESMPDQRLLKALERVNMLDWVHSLPNGLDAHITELGHNLSSGQKQRLAIARAILLDRPFLFFDEPFSYLDSLNTGQLIKVLKEEFQGKTCIINAHQLETALASDFILLLKEGVVEEAGLTKVLQQEQTSSFFRLLQLKGQPT